MQPEDKLRHDIAHYILKKPYDYHADWQRLAVDKHNLDVGSRNWWENSVGLCCVSKYQAGIDYLRNVLTRTNDFLGQEAIADDRHYCFSLEGMMMQREGLRKIDPALAAKVDANILQWWAQIVLCADQMANPGRAVFIYAHQRTVSQKTAADMSEYYFRRGFGLNNLATGLAGLGNRIATNQGPFCPKLFADHFESDLRADIGRIMSAYGAEGYYGVAKLITRGTRGKFTTGRFDNGGYIHALSADFGIDEARLLVYKKASGAVATQFPVGRVPRQKALSDGCTVNKETGAIYAHVETFGDYTGRFDPAGLSMWLETTPDGVHLERYDGQASGDPTPPVVPSAPEPESTIGELFAKTDKNMGVGDDLDWNYGAVTGISSVGGGHYIIRKGGGKNPWSTECIYINKDDGNAYILSETMYNVSDGEVLNMRTFWKDINTPGVLWLPRDLNNGEFYATGYAVFNNISGGTTSLPYNVDPKNNTGVVKTKSTLAMSGSINVAGFRTGFTRTDVMNENTEVYTFGIDSDGLFPYIQWDSYHNGDNVGHAAGTKKRSLGEPADAYVMFYDGTEGRMGSSTRVHSVRPTVVTEKKKSSWMSRFGCSI